MPGWDISCPSLTPVDPHAPARLGPTAINIRLCRLAQIYTSTSTFQVPTKPSPYGHSPYKNQNRPLCLFPLLRQLLNPSTSSPLPRCGGDRERERWPSLCVPSGRSVCGRCGGRSLSPSTTRRRPPSWPRRPPPSRPPSSPSACTRRTRRPSMQLPPPPLSPPPAGPRPWKSRWLTKETRSVHPF